MSRPRLLYVITDLKTGGVPLHLLRLAVAVRDRGLDPHVVSLAPPGAVSAQLAEQGIETHDCRAAGPGDLPAIWRLAGYIRRIRPRLVHSFLFHANVACRLAMPLAGRSHRDLICEIQTVEIERPWHLILGGMTHRMCRCIVGNSPSVVNHLERRAHMAASRLVCIPGGIDAGSVRRASPAPREAFGLHAGAPVLMWVGRMDPVKGLDELIDAFAVVGTRTSAVLLLVGDGPYMDHVRARIGERSLGERVRLLGRRSDVAGLLKMADVFVFPSRTEGMPNALLEAMAAERPIVTTDVAGCRDLIAHDRTGLVVRSGDASALADAILRLLGDRALARSLACRAAEHVEEAYTFHRCVNRYLDLYRQAISTVSERRHRRSPSRPELSKAP